MSNQILITLNQIREHHPCIDGWSKVVRANGGFSADFDKAFPVSSILDSNDLDDTLWVLRCLPNYEHLWRKFAHWCALQNIEKIREYCSSEDYELIFTYLSTDNGKLRSAADNEELRSAAESAADSAVQSTARSGRSARPAARSACSAIQSTICSAIWSAIWSVEATVLSARPAARSAESAATRSAESAAESAQAEKLRQILDLGEWVD